MGSKGSQTTTSNTTQKYTPDPNIAGAANQAISQARTAASTPYTLGPQPVAGFTPDQLSAFQSVRDIQGMAQPYYNTAANLSMQSAQPISAGQIQNYYNPMASAVTSQLQNIFGQQQKNITGNLTQAAGGIGADRIAVGQSNLANQQGLAAGQTYAGLYQNALQAAQQEQQMKANAAYAQGQLGTASQNSALQGAQALYGTGSLQQQLAQAQQLAPYQQQVQQFMYPFQTAQYLAGITGGLAPALGGTTEGTQTVTGPKPNMLSQIAGGLMFGLGTMGSMGGFGSGKGSDSANPSMGTTVGYGPGSVSYYGGVPYQQFKRGGRANGGTVEGTPFEEAGLVPLPRVSLQSGTDERPMNMPTLNVTPSGGGASGSESGGNDTMKAIQAGAQIAMKVLPFLLKDGGKVSAGGAVNPYAPMMGYADGGMLSFDDRFAPAATLQPAISPISGETPYQALMSGMDAQRQPVMRNLGLGQPVDWSPVQEGAPQAVAAGQPIDIPPMAYPAVPNAGPQAMPPAAQQPAPYQMAQMPESQIPYPQATKMDAGQSMVRSPWMALTQAGLATMAGTSPFAAVNIGKGGLEGVKFLEQQREQARHEVDTNLRAKQLWQQAQQHADQYKYMTPYQKETVDIQRQQAARQLAIAAVQALQPVKIGQDPSTGLDVMGIRDPKTGEIKIIDPTTGKERAIGAAGGKEPVKFPQPEAPYGVKELQPDLQPSKITTPTMMKGPFATAEAGNIKAIDAQMNKERNALDTQKDQLTRMKSAYATVMKDADKDGFFTSLVTLPGADTTARIAAAKKANMVAMAAGRLPPFNPEKIAAVEEADKIQKTMGMSFAATISPRDSQMMQMASISAQPGFTNSPLGMLKLISIYDAAVRRGEDRSHFWGRWRLTNPHTSVGWEEDFRTKNPVDKTMVNSIIDNLPNPAARQRLPEAIKFLKENKANPEVIKKFDKIYGNTASYFLTGRFDPYAGLQ